MNKFFKKLKKGLEKVVSFYPARILEADPYLQIQHSHSEIELISLSQA
jgi:hypothetical protein